VVWDWRLRDEIGEEKGCYVGHWSVGVYQLRRRFSRAFAFVLGFFLELVEVTNEGAFLGLAPLSFSFESTSETFLFLSYYKRW
jgi:hypothetical protein